jgi:type VI secretion system protein VasD
MRLTRLAVWTSSLLLTGACGSKQPQPTAKELLEQMKPCDPPPIEVFLQADPKLNPNPDGQAMPVEVRVLLLKQRQTLDQLDFETAWKKGAEALGKDLVDSASTMVFPGKEQIHPINSATGVAYVALVALFRQPRRQGWKHVVDIRTANRRCSGEDQEALHTIVHARLHGTTITGPTHAVGPASDK